jgi:Flp pilus assembly pilin Flp
MSNLIVRFLREDSGQDLIEYAFLASGIGIAALIGITALGGALNTYYNNLATSAPITATP